jgi:branched-chain amino acid transport system substrate-binding protein
MDDVIVKSGFQTSADVYRDLTPPGAAAPAATTAPAATAATATPAAAAAAPAVVPTTNGEIKVAILAPISGANPTFGTSTKEGALMAIDEWNAKGGVLGKKIVPVVEDSSCTPDGGTNAANKVIEQDKVHYIVGEVCSKATIAIAQIANAKGVLEISPTSTNASVTVDASGKVKPFIFRACFIDPFQGKVAASFVWNTLKLKTAFVMSDQGNDYVKGLAEAFTTSFTALGGKVVGTESYNGSTDKDFSAILAKIANAKPDLVYLPDYYPVVNLVTKQAKEKGITAPFMGGDGWDSSDLDTTAADGGFYTNHYSPDSTDAVVVNFVKAYGAKYQDDKNNPKVPDALGALAYDATNILLQSITNGGSDDAAKARDAMAAIKFNGVSGSITFDAQHNPIKSAVILQVKGGKVVFNSVVNP